MLLRVVAVPTTIRAAGAGWAEQDVGDAEGPDLPAQIERQGEDELPDTGRLRSDVLEYLRRAAAKFDSPLGALLRGLFGDMLAGDPAFTALIRERTETVDPIRVGIFLDRAVQRGEVDAWVLGSRRATVAADLLRHHFFLYGAPIDDNAIVDIVDDGDDVFLPLVCSPAPARHR